MNVSMADAWNLGWKLGAVLRGTGEAGAAAHLLAGAPGRRAGADRLRPRVLQAVHRPRGGRRPRGVPAVLRRAGPLHRGRRDALRPLDDHGRGDAPAPRGGVPGRDALPLRARHATRRRQARRARPRRPGRRRLARLRLRRRARARASARCASSWPGPSAGSRRRAPTRTPSSTCAPSSSRAIASWTSTRLPPALLPRKGGFGLIDYEKAFCPDPRQATSSTCAAWTATRLHDRRASRPVRRARAAAGRARGAGGLLRRRPARGALSQRSPTMPTRMTTRVARVGSASETKSRTGAW